MTTPFNIVNSLQWRHAIKLFKPIPTGHQVNIKPILEAIRLSPSAFGMQPYNIHVVTNPELKKKLREVSFNQPQVTDCSHLLIFCARNDPIPTIERLINDNNLDVVSKSYADALRKNVILDPNEFLQWSKNMTFIGLGVGVSAASALRIGHCPMNGFDPDGVKKVANIPENQFPVAYLAIGSEFDDGMDKITDRIKYRVSFDNLFTMHD